MSHWLRCLVLLLSAGAAVPVAASSRCPAGDAYDLAVSAERALARADWPLAARKYGCATQRSDDVAVAERATRIAYDNHQLDYAVAGARRWLELAPDSEVARRYRYVDGGEELYDESKDPYEWTNLAWAKRKPDAKTLAQMEEMRKLLHADQRANAR